MTSQGRRFYFIYITAGNKTEAKKIGRALVKGRLAACVNIIDKMESLYWWKGKIETGREVVLIAKTTGQKVDALIRAVKALHSYENPCVVALPLSKGSTAFLNWIGEETEKRA